MRARTWRAAGSLRAFGWIGLLALVAVACSEDEPPAPPGSFDRPTRVAFACLDVDDASGGKPVPLAQCEPGNLRTSASGRSRDVLHALVVQSSRGEVAAVDLADDVAIDSREDIPGFTFLPVGELPTAIVAPALERNVDFTYVLSSGSRDVTVLRTQSFRQIATTEDPVVQTVQLPGGSRDAPLDMVLAPEEDALFVSIPATGRLLRLPIVRCDDPSDCAFGSIDADGITEVPLSASIGRAQPAMDGQPMSSEPYVKTCEYGGPISNRPLAVPPLPDDIANTTPQPSGLAIDSFCQADRPCSQRLLVADEALPLVHVIDIDAWREAASDAAVLAPILTGAPTRTVAVTPRVPVDLGEEPAETQYVYAIDARDGSVLVTQDGRLLEVGTAGARPDRITIGGGASVPLAVSLSILTPSFDVHGPAAQYARDGGDPDDGIPMCTDPLHEIRNNARLRGVFLAIGVGDGGVRIIDIHDMDLAECRHCQERIEGCTCPDPDGDGPEAPPAECDQCEYANVDPYPVVRHRARIAATATESSADPPLAARANPAFAIEATLVQVRINGSTSDPRLRGLECVECVDGQAAAYPDESLTGTPGDGTEDDELCAEGSARVCALADPWADLDDWIASYHGAIPGSRGGQGQILQSGDGVRLVAEGARFCGLGVLGSDQLDGRTGDRVVFVGELAPEAAIRATIDRSRTFENNVVRACNALARARDRDTAPVPIAFEIRESFDGELALESSLRSASQEVTRVFSDSDNPFANHAELVSTCFGNVRFAYELRAGEGYIVTGRNHVGFLHRVRADEATGRCSLDPDQDPKRTGRAYEDTRFDNGFVTFQLRGGEGTVEGTAFSVGLSSTTPKTAMNASLSVNEQVIASIPYDLRWSGTDNTLYMVDIASRGLLQIPVDPFPQSVPRSIQ